jgi:hypothetical protein
MDADWEVEIGGSAPIIEAAWPGFINLREHPERIGEIAEVNILPPLADLLLKLNATGSPLWTSKCDAWIPEAGGLACYVDLLPRDLSIFDDWRCVEALCREWVRRLSAREVHQINLPPGRHAIHIAAHGHESEAEVTLVVRRAITSQREGFGITAYFNTGISEKSKAETAIAATMVAFSNAVPAAAFQKSEDRD